MKKFFLLALCISTLCLISCSSDDDDFPKSVNIKYSVETTRNTDAIITHTFENDTQTDIVENLPYTFTLGGEEISEDTYLKLTYLENGEYAAGQGGSTWTDYEAVLSILIDEEVVKTETFSIVEFSSGLVQIDYTVN